MANMEIQGSPANKTKLEQAFNFLTTGSANIRSQVDILYAKANLTNAAVVIR